MSAPAVASCTVEPLCSSTVAPWLWLSGTEPDSIQGHRVPRDLARSRPNRRGLFPAAFIRFFRRIQPLDLPGNLDRRRLCSIAGIVPTRRRR